MMHGTASAQELALISHKSYCDQNTPFRQQTGEKWMPKMTKWKSITLCSVIGAVLLLVGGGLYVSVSSIVQVLRHHSSARARARSPARMRCTAPRSSRAQTDVVYYHSTPAGTAATVDVTIPKDMSAPVYVYYRIDNFFQNHRRYVISRDEKQLRGMSIASPTTCAPLQRFSDLATHRDGSFTAPPNSTADSDKILYPCGLAAVTAFSDVMSACVLAGGSGTCDPVTWDKSEIDYPSDEKKYVAAYTTADGFDASVMTVSSPFVSSRVDPTNAAGTTRLLPVLGDEDLTVWMRMASTSSFHKLYRVIHRDLSEGDVLRFTITNSWDVHPFDGKKGVVLATKHFLGGKSQILPVVFMITGAACVFEALFVFVLTRWCPGYVPLDGR